MLCHHFVLPVRKFKIIKITLLNYLEPFLIIPHIIKHINSKIKYAHSFNRVFLSFFIITFIIVIIIKLNKTKIRIFVTMAKPYGLELINPQYINSSTAINKPILFKYLK